MLMIFLTVVFLLLIALTHRYVVVHGLPKAMLFLVTPACILLALAVFATLKIAAPREPNAQTSGMSHKLKGEDILFVVWLVLLLPWLPLFFLSGMAFDAGPTLEAYVFVFFLWTYPISVFIVGILRNKKPLLALLPLLNVLGIFSDFLWK